MTKETKKERERERRRGKRAKRRRERIIRGPARVGGWDLLVGKGRQYFHGATEASFRSEEKKKKAKREKKSGDLSIDVLGDFNGTDSGSQPESLHPWVTASLPCMYRHLWYLSVFTCILSVFYFSRNSLACAISCFRLLDRLSAQFVYCILIPFLLITI